MNVFYNMYDILKIKPPAFLILRSCFPPQSIDYPLTYWVFYLFTLFTACLSLARM